MDLGIACALASSLVVPAPPAAPSPVWPSRQAEKALADLVGEDLFREHLVFRPDESRFEPAFLECERNDLPRPRVEPSRRLPTTRVPGRLGGERGVPARPLGRAG